MKLFNTLSREKQQIETIDNKKVRLYTCGLTVYSQPHIGNWVAYIYWDILNRILIEQGYEVNRVQNITDVGHLTSDEDSGEDKMLKSALKEGVSAWQVAEKYSEIADMEAYNQLGLIRPTKMPKATEFIDQQIEFVKELEAKGFTYKIADGIYFDTSKLEDYGKLAKLDIDGLQFGARVADTGKKNPTDFAVWKFSNPEEKRDMEWDSPWGVGFPGWHLECSVMARELLGDTIDIHTGGVDHIPVHHTNEIAQSESVTGTTFANYWVHANHIKVNGTKMSKSLGNIYTLEEIQNKGYSLEAFKLLILSKHYRTEGNFNWEILEAAQNRLDNWQAAFDMRFSPVESDDDGDLVEQLNDQILYSLGNDLDTPEAVAHVDTIVNYIEKTGVNETSLPLLNETLRILNEVLNIHLIDKDIDDEIKDLLSKRADARQAKNWAESDKLRDQLRDLGIGVKDSGNIQSWFRI